MPSSEPLPGKCGHMLFDGSGLYCENGAGKGTDHKGFGHCKKHGGTNATGDKHGKKLMAVAACETFGIPIKVDAHVALLEELWRTNGWVHYLHSLVIAEGVADEKSGTWKLYDQQRDRLVKVGAECARAGVEERLVRVLEVTAEAFVTFGQAMLTSMGVDLFSDEARRYLDAGLAALPAELVST